MDRAQVEVGQGGWTIDGATTHVSWPWADSPPLKDEKLHLTGVVHQLQLQQFGDNFRKTFRQFLDNFAILRQLWDNFEPIEGQLWDRDEKIHLALRSGTTTSRRSTQLERSAGKRTESYIPKPYLEKSGNGLFLFSYILWNPIWGNRVITSHHIPGVQLVTQANRKDARACIQCIGHQQERQNQLQVSESPVLGLRVFITSLSLSGNGCWQFVFAGREPTTRNWPGLLDFMILMAAAVLTSRRWKLLLCRSIIFFTMVPYFSKTVPYCTTDPYIFTPQSPLSPRLRRNGWPEHSIKLRLDP